jgi:hypothetical protein
MSKHLLSSLAQVRIEAQLGEPLTQPLPLEAIPKATESPADSAPTFQTSFKTFVRIL